MFVSCCTICKWYGFIPKSRCKIQITDLWEMLVSRESVREDLVGLATIAPWMRMIFSSVRTDLFLGLFPMQSSWTDSVLTNFSYILPTVRHDGASHLVQAVNFSCTMLGDWKTAIQAATVESHQFEHALFIHFIRTNGLVPSVMCISMCENTR